jgi:hypothetical protein
VQELLPTDLEQRVRYCLWFQRLIGGHPGVLDIAWIQLSGYINTQNTCVWPEENPHEIHKKPLYSDKIVVWCTLSRRRIISPMFFDQIVTTEVYFNIVVNQITDDELMEVTFNKMAQRAAHNTQACGKLKVISLADSF